MTEAPKLQRSGRSGQPGRLKSRPDFLAVQKGERRKGPLFLLEVLDHGDASRSPRVGFTVTRRQGNAVERNRMRRRLREAVRLMPETLFAPGHDYVLVARRDVLDASFSRLTSALKDRIEGATKARTAARRARGPDAQAPEAGRLAAGASDGNGNRGLTKARSAAETGPETSGHERSPQAVGHMPGPLPRTDAQE